ncbi:MAG: AraC family transcriptional regulator [Christensenellales bacterium]
MANIHLLDFSGPLLQIMRTPVLRCVGRCKDLAGYTICRHSHPNTMEMLYIVQGEGTTQVEGRSYPLSSGMIALYNPGVAHAETFDKDAPTPYFYHLKFDEFVISGLTPSCLLPKGFSPTFSAGSDAGAIQTLMTLLFNEAESQRLGYDQIAQNLLLSIVLMTLRILDADHAHIEKTESDSLIVQIQHHIQRHYAEKLSMKDVANHFHINYYYLSHLFKKEMGVSPSNYLTAFRINAACRLLSTTKLPIYRIAEMVGYANQSNFQTQFKRHKGMPPLQYRAYYEDNNLMVQDETYKT